MWAQLIKMRVKPDKLAELPGLFDQLNAAEQPGSGLVRTTVTQDQKDPTQLYVLVVFDSEEKAREREQDPIRAAELASAQQMMTQVFDGPPEFVDMTVLLDVSQ